MEGNWLLSAVEPFSDTCEQFSVSQAFGRVARKANVFRRADVATLVCAVNQQPATQIATAGVVSDPVFQSRVPQRHYTEDVGAGERHGFGNNVRL